MNDSSGQETPVADLDPELAARESGIREALRVVVDPEIGMDVVTLGLIRAIDFHEDFTEVTMILTTPFCPYGGSMVQQVKMTAEEAVGGDVKVTMGEEQWSPDMLEGGDWAEWGLV
jgi:metal-sulfur cluster biosynthetic enzyme